MLGVFALVVMTSVMDGVMDKIATGFSGMSWDGTVMLAPDSPATTEEQKRFAMSPGLRWEDLPRLTAPDPKVLAYLPRATKQSAVKVAGGTERCWVNGVWPDYARWMNRPIAMGRGLTDDDERRRSTVAVVGATLGSKLFGGADPVGRDITVEGVRFRVVGVQAPSQIFTEELWYDANGISIPLQTYVDRIDSEHKLSNVAVKLATQARHGRGLGPDDRPRQAGAPRDRGRRRSWTSRPRPRARGSTSSTRSSAGRSCSRASRRRCCSSEASACSR